MEDMYKEVKVTEKALYSGIVDTLLFLHKHYNNYGFSTPAFINERNGNRELIFGSEPDVKNKPEYGFCIESPDEIGAIDCYEIGATIDLKKFMDKGIDNLKNSILGD